MNIRIFALTMLIGSLLVQTSASAIVNGKKVLVGSKVSKQVALIGIWRENSSPPFNNCTGTFIAKTIVVTAAHCVNKLKDIHSIKISVDGDYNKSFKTTGKRVIAKIDTDMQLIPENDIALIQTQDPLPQDYYTTKLAVHPHLQNSQVMAAGFGITTLPWDNMVSVGSPKLRRTILSKNKTFNLFGIFQYNLGSDEIVISTEKSGISLGDSGGPLFVQEGRSLLQIGVASNISPGLARYAPISKNLGWIMNQIRDGSKWTRIKHENPY